MAGGSTQENGRIVSRFLSALKEVIKACHKRIESVNFIQSDDVNQSIVVGPCRARGP